MDFSWPRFAMVVGKMDRIGSPYKLFAFLIKQRAIGNINEKVIISRWSFVVVDYFDFPGDFSTNDFPASNVGKINDGAVKFQVSDIASDGVDFYRLVFILIFIENHDTQRQ